MFNVQSQHIDGSMDALARDALLAWLKAPSPDGQCNVRCLSEGVDVPSLDPVMFLSASNSEIDVVQSVGRVMRRAQGKKHGYIIIPVVVPATVSLEEALNDNNRYKVVWTGGNALRAHEDRFDATVNKIDLNKKRPEQILVGRPEYSWEEGRLVGQGQAAHNSQCISVQLAMQFQQLQHVVFARMVEKVGNRRRYSEQWAYSVAEIAERKVARLSQLVARGGPHAHAFERFTAMEIIKILRIHQQMTGSDYLFPILHERHKSAVTTQNRLKKIHTQVNADLKVLGQMAGVSIPMTTYVARHTYATVLKRSGVATGVISESMGHATEKITQTYLASFERESFDAVNDALL